MFGLCLGLHIFPSRLLQPGACQRQITLGSPFEQRIGLEQSMSDIGQRVGNVSPEEGKNVVFLISGS